MVWCEFIFPDVVIVTFNARLGAFGYLFHPPDITGNFGHEDSLMALQWLTTNIHAFDGDASRLTLFGLSSAAYATSLILTDERAPPISNVIIMSSPSGIQMKTREEARVFGNDFVTRVGCTLGDVACLRGKSGLEISRASTLNVRGWLEHVLGDGLRWGPIIDGRWLTGRSIDLVRSPLISPKLRLRLANTNVIIGNTKYETAFFAAPAEMLGLFPGGIMILLAFGYDTWREIAGASDVDWNQLHHAASSSLSMRHFLDLTFDSNRNTTLHPPSSSKLHLLSARRMFQLLSNATQSDQNFKSTEDLHWLYTVCVTRLMRADDAMVAAVMRRYPFVDSVSECVAQLIQMSTEYMFSCCNHRVCSSTASILIICSSLPWTWPILGPPFSFTNSLKPARLCGSFRKMRTCAGFLRCTHWTCHSFGAQSM